jgi:hydroxymethylglutaryl-CoA synthase
MAVAYGSGAGGDGFDITVTEEIENVRARSRMTMKGMLARTESIDYATYAKYRGKIRIKEGTA